MSSKKISEFPELEAIDVTNDDVMPIVNDGTNKKFSWANIKTALGSIFSPLASPTFTGTVTTPAIAVSNETPSRVAIIDGSQNIKSANTTTYPNLTELSYIKGLSSAVQTQIDGKQAAFGSQTQHYFYAAPSGLSGAPSFRAIVDTDIPTLNQNTTGSAASLTTSRNIDGQAFNGTANITVIAPGTHAAADKDSLDDSDEFPLVDSDASYVLKKTTLGNFKITLKSYFDALYPTATLDTNGTLSPNSDTRVASQKATKTYADAKVADAINNGTTTIAPSQNAVYDALQLKQDSSKIIGLAYAIGRGYTMM
jgi:hypothetical protein